MPNLLIHHK